MSSMKPRRLIKILQCTNCQTLAETIARVHTRRCCGERMHIVSWRTPGE